MSPGARAAAPLALALLTVTFSAPAQKGQIPANDTYDAALARHAECERRIPFRFHVNGRERLARTHDPRAVPILTDIFRRPRDHEEFARYTLASMFGRDLNIPEAVAPFAELRKKFKQPIDAWMWMNTLIVDCRQNSNEAALDAAYHARSTALKAAAIAALVKVRDPAVLGIIPTICAELPKKDGERRMLIAVLGPVVKEFSRRRTDESYQAAAKAIIHLLDEDVGLDNSAKMVLARYLAKTFGIETLFVNPEPWLGMLAAGARPKSGGRGTKVIQTFFGVEAEGDRVCYVVDMSDTMCKPIDPGLLKDKPKGPLTGPRRRKKLKKGYIPTEADIPWHSIKTRFDLAREQLRISIQRLTPEKRFCVVKFGTEANTLDSCKGMIKATRANVDRVLNELDRIEPGKTNENAPDGTLEGKTNIHAGMRLAFRLRPRGIADEAEYVDIKAAELGTDTIFLLSDGTPSFDDFQAKDRDYGEGNVVKDQEYGKSAARTPMLWYTGPYAMAPWLSEDIRRMNMFRKAQIHCIGIGEADINLLRSIAKSNDGKVFLFGAKAKKAGGKMR